MRAPTKILVPTDFSEYSDKALGQALSIAKEYHAKVYVLHVTPEDIYDAAGHDVIPRPVAQRVRDHVTATETENMEKQLARFPEVSEVEIHREVMRGVHYQTILAEADRLGIDLIVIASLGRSAIAKFLIGGVARNILKGAKCPVLLIK